MCASEYSLLTWLSELDTIQNKPTRLSDSHSHTEHSIWIALYACIIALQYFHSFHSSLDSTSKTWKYFHRRGQGQKRHSPSPSTDKFHTQKKNQPGDYNQGREENGQILTWQKHYSTIDLSKANYIFNMITARINGQRSTDILAYPQHINSLCKALHGVRRHHKKITQKTLKYQRPFKVK